MPFRERPGAKAEESEAPPTADARELLRRLAITTDENPGLDSPGEMMVLREALATYLSMLGRTKKQEETIGMALEHKAVLEASNPDGIKNFLAEFPCTKVNLESLYAVACSILDRNWEGAVNDRTDRSEKNQMKIELRKILRKLRKPQAAEEAAAA